MGKQVKRVNKTEEFWVWQGYIRKEKKNLFFQKKSEKISFSKNGRHYVSHWKQILFSIFLFLRSSTWIHKCQVSMIVHECWILNLWWNTVKWNVNLAILLFHEWLELLISTSWVGICTAVVGIGIATDILSQASAVTIALLLIDCNWLESSI